MLDSGACWLLRGEPSDGSGNCFDIRSSQNCAQNGGSCVCEPSCGLNNAYTTTTTTKRPTTVTATTTIADPLNRTSTSPPSPATRAPVDASSSPSWLFAAIGGAAAFVVVLLLVVVVVVIVRRRRRGDKSQQPAMSVDDRGPPPQSSPTPTHRSEYGQLKLSEPRNEYDLLTMQSATNSSSGGNTRYQAMPFSSTMQSTHSTHSSSAGGDCYNVIPTRTNSSSAGGDGYNVIPTRSNSLSSSAGMLPPPAASSYSKLEMN